MMHCCIVNSQFATIWHQIAPLNEATLIALYLEYKVVKPSSNLESYFSNYFKNIGDAPRRVSL